MEIIMSFVTGLLFMQVVFTLFNFTVLVFIYKKMCDKDEL